MSVIVENNVCQMTVGKNTNVHNLAVSVSKTITVEKRRVQLIAIGANSVNQMVKAAAKARAFLAPVGIDIFWKVYFTDREITNAETQLVEKLSAVVMESKID